MMRLIRRYGWWAGLFGLVGWFTIGFVVSLQSDPLQGNTAVEPLFYIRRNIDQQEVHYVLKRSEKGGVDERQPFDIYWAAKGSGEKTRSLNMIQRRFVYGVRVREVRDDRIDFQIAAYPQLSFSLQRDEDQYRVYINIDGVRCTLDHIHVQLHDKNVMNPKVNYVRVSGLDAAGNPRSSQIDP